MSSVKAAALVLWTLAFAFCSFFVFGILMMGDCFENSPQFTACMASKATAPTRIAVSVVAAYGVLTWLIFGLAWRKAR